MSSTSNIWRGRRKLDEPLRQRPLAHVLQAERLGDGGDDQSGIADRGKAAKTDPIREVRCDPLSDREGEASLARPTRARQREEPDCGFIEERTNGSDLCLSPDEWREGQRESEQHQGACLGYVSALLFGRAAARSA